MFLLLAATVPAQHRQWIVDASGGAGTDFTDLPPAIRVAVAGDVILVRPGSYSPFLLDKGVAIEGVAVTIGRSTTARPSVDIQNLPAGQHAALRGLTLSDDLRPLGVANCPGSVLLDRLEFTPFTSSVATLAIDGASQVTIAGGTFRGRPAVQAVGSTVTITDATLLAGPVTSPLGSASPALVATHARVFLSRCTLTGGNNFPVAPAGPAIAAFTSQLVITDDGSNLLQSGQGTSVAILRNEGGTLLLDPAVRFGAGVRVGGSGSVTTRPVPSLRGIGVAIGNVVNLDLFSPAGDIVLLLLGLPGPELVVPELGGSAFLDPLSLSVPAVGVQGPGGHFLFPLAVPPDPNLVGVACVWQAVSGTLARGFWLSNAASYVH